MNFRLVLISLVIFIAGCVSYATVEPGSQDYNGLKIKTSQAWNLAPKEVTPAARPESKLWTQDGILLDRIMIIPGVANGESLFKTLSSDQALPVFQAGMLPNEIEELTESSIVKLFGESGAVVETTNLRPHQYGDRNGILFDMSVAVSDGPNYRGVAGAIVVAEHLYLIFYLGAVPYYYEKHLDEAMVIIKGARV